MRVAFGKSRVSDGDAIPPAVSTYFLPKYRCNQDIEPETEEVNAAYTVDAGIESLGGFGGSNVR